MNDDDPGATAAGLTADGSAPMPPVVAPAVPAVPARSRRRTVGGSVMLAGAVGLIGAEAAVQQPAESWVWVRVLLWHPITTWVVALGLVVAGLRLAIRSEVFAGLAIAAALLVGVPVLALGAMLGQSSAGEPDERFVSPDGRFEAVVDHESVHIMEPGAHVWIETREGLLSRRWLAGCLDGDDPDDDFGTFRWVSSTSAEVRTVGGEVLPLTVDAASGIPLTRANSAGITTEYGCGSP